MIEGLPRYPHVAAGVDPLPPPCSDAPEIARGGTMAIEIPRRAEALGGQRTVAAAAH
jgi:hypothetical protein